MNFRVTIDDRDFLKKARALPDKLERKVYRSAVAKSSTPTLREARNRAPSQTVRKALTKRAQSNASKGYFGSIITVKSGVFRSNRTATRKGGSVYFPDEAIRFYRFLELGTKYHAAQPFLTPALAAGKGEYKRKLTDEINRGIEKVT